MVFLSFPLQGFAPQACLLDLYDCASECQIARRGTYYGAPTVQILYRHQSGSTTPAQSRIPIQTDDEQRKLNFREVVQLHVYQTVVLIPT